MYYSLRILSFILLCIPCFATAQLKISDTDQQYFSAPLHIPMYLSGNFGELRSNHFHSGIDIKTQGREGLKVYAPADGTVSRIKVSPFGFGHALYIDHPNGMTTAYAHLSRFSPAIAAFIKQEQYNAECFEVDVTVPAGTFDIKKGEVIAYTGNTGGSGGPHLHFEIRETESEHPINPLLFNFDIKDSTPPVIKGLMVYPLSETATVNGQHKKRQYSLRKSGQNYTLSNGNSIKANGTIGLGLFVQDFLDGSGNRCGIFSNELRVDNELIYAFVMDEFSFDDSRYANSYVDYAYLKQNRVRYQKSFVDAGNQMTNFYQLRNRGTIDVAMNDNLQVDYQIKDVAGNQSNLSFQIIGDGQAARPTQHTAPIAYNRDTILWGDNCMIELPAQTFYTNNQLSLKEQSPSSNTYSKTISFGSPYIPVHQHYKMQIKANTLPAHLQSKAILVSLDSNKQISGSLGGNYDDGWVIAEVRELGSFAVGVDTIAPSIKSLSIDNHKSLNNKKRLNFKISDNLSGIDTYRGEIDGKWVLFEYDPKTRSLFYWFDEQSISTNQNHELTLEVTDAKGNTASYKASFFR